MTIFLKLSTFSGQINPIIAFLIFWYLRSTLNFVALGRSSESVPGWGFIISVSVLAGPIYQCQISQMRTIALSQIDNLSNELKLIIEFA